MTQPGGDLLDEMASARAAGRPFAVATVTRTVALTAAKVGAKAMIGSDGSISAGWIGGGCARGAVVKAAIESLRDGKPRLISVQPPAVLGQSGHQAGQVVDGVQYAANMCPSEGTMDIFIEPFLLPVELVVLGATPIAVTLADLGKRLGYRVTVVADPGEYGRFGCVDRKRSDPAELEDDGGERYVVVATQGRGDEACLRAASKMPARYVAFVGSRRKVAALLQRMRDGGLDTKPLERLHAPAGLDLGSVTPEEIALSILAEITIERRRKHQEASGKTPPQ